MLLWGRKPCPCCWVFSIVSKCIQVTQCTFFFYTLGFCEKKKTSISFWEQAIIYKGLPKEEHQGMWQLIETRFQYLLILPWKFRLSSECNEVARKHWCALFSSLLSQVQFLMHKPENIVIIIIIICCYYCISQ